MHATNTVATATDTTQLPLLLLFAFAIRQATIIAPNALTAAPRHKLINNAATILIKQSTIAICAVFKSAKESSANPRIFEKRVVSGNRYRLSLEARCVCNNVHPNNPKQPAIQML